jgi:hypothetical protein
MQVSTLITTDVPQSPRCLNRTGHAADRCQLRPQPTAVGQTTTVTPRSGPGGTTSSGMVISVGVNHTWHYGNPATVAVQIPTVVIETPTVAVQIRNKPKRRRRKRPDKAAKRARLAADQTNSQDPTPAGVKTEDTGGNMKREAP